MPNSKQVFHIKVVTLQAQKFLIIHFSGEKFLAINFSGEKFLTINFSGEKFLHEGNHENTYLNFFPPHPDIHFGSNLYWNAKKKLFLCNQQTLVKHMYQEQNSGMKISQEGSKISRLSFFLEPSNILLATSIFYNILQKFLAIHFSGMKFLTY